MQDADITKVAESVIKLTDRIPDDLLDGIYAQARILAFETLIRHGKVPDKPNPENKVGTN